MAIPRCLILVASVHHRNTVRVAEAMAGVLGADVLAPEATPVTSLDAYRLVGFGSGVYYGRLHDSLHDWVRGLPDAPAASRPAFVFSTSGLPMLAPLWHTSLTRLLVAKGFEILGAFACRGYDTWGPLRFTGGLNRGHPDARDLERARRFAEWLEAAA